MIGVAQQDLDAELVELRRCDAFHRTLGADRHEHRRLDRAVRRVEAAAPRSGVPVLGQELEADAVVHRMSIPSP
jgi:hypothetical protein